ncbi:MAG TPA: hypothetical protein VM261_04115 [Kofleriaceae bacterium]|nr:hypothetical protein [Kofleriaceae bacterium]
MPTLITDVKLVNYSPAPDAQIEATAIIGNGQLGAWSMFLDQQFLQGGHNGAAVRIGQGAALDGKVLEISAAISDVQGAHDRLSFRVHLTGLAQPIEIEHDAEPGGRAAYSVLVQFGA